MVIDLPFKGRKVEGSRKYRGRERVPKVGSRRQETITEPINYKLSNNSRYIDDIGVCNMNNNNEFMICSKDIYPESIPLTTGCIENDKDTFLDLDITLEENRFITKIYNKVDDFDFEVVSFPFPTSNMSDHITYNSFYSQLVRFSSVCSKFNDFDIRSRNLLESFSKYRLKNSFSKFALNHHDVLNIKYSMEEIYEFIRSHFS